MRILRDLLRGVWFAARYAGLLLLLLSLGTALNAGLMLGWKLFSG